MMTYTMIKICVFALFLHSLQCSTTENHPPNYEMDAVNIRIATKGLGVDKQALVDLVVPRSNAERQEIRKAYLKQYQKDLIKVLRTKLSGEFKTAVVGLMLTNLEFYAKEMRDAMTTIWGTNEKAISEILGSSSRSEIKEISNIYEREYGTKLKDDIINRTTEKFPEDFQKLLVTMLDNDREYHNIVHAENATRDAKILVKACKIPTSKESQERDQRTMISILTTRSVPQLREIIKEFAKIKKRGIIKNIKTRVYDYQTEFLILTIIQCAISKTEYFADRLHDAMEGVGTNDRQLIRIIVGRSEIDLEEIKQIYQKKYKTPLINAVADETAGIYKNLLMAVINK